MQRVMLLLLFASVLFSAEISGELKMWHKVTITFNGPETSQDAVPNPFLDYRFDVTFSNGNSVFTVPGYFAADGNAANTSATSGDQWRVHFMPDAIGLWQYTVSFRSGENVAVDDDPFAGQAYAPLDGMTGSFTIEPTDKMAPDMRAKGRLDYVGERYLQFAGTGDYFLKAGPDAPENFLAYHDFDGPFKNDGVKDDLIKKWQAHVQDWQAGDPVWQGDKGKGIIGALNYLASKGMNTLSFLSMNINGDDRNVFMYTNYNERVRIDISRMDQWEIVFNHAAQKGLHLHFKTQEAENQNLLDGGDTAMQRRLYYRELVARFAHHPALSWNMGEENGKWGGHNTAGHFQTREQRLAMADFLYHIDPYHHNIGIHNGQWFDDIYGPEAKYTAASLQSWTPSQNHDNYVLKILRESENAGKIWCVASDEQGPASTGCKPDKDDFWHDDMRKEILWSTLIAGGFGAEFYFGYQFDHSDLDCQDFRSRDNMWNLSKIALDFFYQFEFWNMQSADALVNGSAWCLAQQGAQYIVYARENVPVELDLTAMPDTLLTVKFFNPKTAETVLGSAVRGGQKVTLNAPAEMDDFAAYVEQADDLTPPTAPDALDAKAMGEREIQLSWSGGFDEDSGLGGYNVYRNDEYVTTISPDSTRFLDRNLIPNTEYRYTVAAINGSGVVGPAAGPVKATTWEDTTPPEILSISVSAGHYVYIFFSELLDEASAEIKENYKLTPDIPVSRATLRNDGLTVMLRLNEDLAEDVTYTLTVSNVTDISGVAVTAKSGTRTLSLSSDKIWIFAEDAELQSGAELITNTASLGSKVAVCPSASAKLKFTVNVPQEGEWFIWGRMFFNGSDNDPNSFLLSVDDGMDLKFGNSKSYWNEWHWDGDGNVESGNSPLSLGTLTAGEHTLVFSAREPLGAPGTRDVMLDMLYLAMQSDQPTDASAPTRTTVANKQLFPAAFRLLQNYPNPFNPTTTISYELPEPAQVKIEILNALGQVVDEFSAYSTLGQHDFQWSSSNSLANCSSGVYFCRVTATTGSTVFMDMKKMLLIK